MRARWILNLVLAAIVIGLALLAYLKPSADKAGGTPLTNLAPEAASRIRVERGGQAIALAKTASQWRMTEPLPARANRFNVDSLLRVLTAASEYRAPAKP